MRAHVTSLIIKTMLTEITIVHMVHDCHSGMVLDQAILTGIATMEIEEATIEMKGVSDAVVIIDEAVTIVVIVIIHGIVRHHAVATKKCERNNLNILAGIFAPDKTLSIVA